MNSLLWGCEAWSLRKISTNKTWSLSTFYKYPSHPTNIYFQVERERITNDQVRKRFYDIQCVENMIAAGYYHSLGKLYEILLTHPLPCLQKTLCHSDTIIRHPSHEISSTARSTWESNICRKSSDIWDFQQRHVPVFLKHSQIPWLTWTKTTNNWRW